MRLAPRILPPLRQSQTRNFSGAYHRTRWWQPRRPSAPFRGARPRLSKAVIGGGVAGAGVGAVTALSPAAFVRIGEEDQNDDKTGEQHMLDASRAELDAKVPRFVGKSDGLRGTLYYYIDTYIWEPICTGLRFFHLVVIFVPVVLTVPMIWFGSRDPNRDNEKTGTIWWYGFLVGSMERAGAAFIKVSRRVCDGGQE